MTEFTSQSVLERYDLAQGAHDETWKIGFGPGITEDLQCLDAWAATAEDPLQDFKRGLLDLPEVHSLSARVAAQIDRGPAKGLWPGCSSCNR